MSSSPQGLASVNTTRVISCNCLQCIMIHITSVCLNILKWEQDFSQKVWRVFFKAEGKLSVWLMNSECFVLLANKKKKRTQVIPFFFLSVWSLDSRLYFWITAIMTHLCIVFDHLSIFVWLSWLSGIYAFSGQIFGWLANVFASPHQYLVYTFLYLSDHIRYFLIFLFIYHPVFL